MKINLTVGQPIKISTDDNEIYKTELTHPRLEGQLSFFHGKNNRDEILVSLTSTMVEDVAEIIKNINSLTTKK